MVKIIPTADQFAQCPSEFDQEELEVSLYKLCC